MHMYTVCPYHLQCTKFHEILLSGLEELQWQIISEFHFILAKFLRSKKDVTAKKKKRWIKMSCKYAHLHGMTFWLITTRFHHILLSGFRRVALTNTFSAAVYFFGAKFLSSKEA